MENKIVSELENILKELTILEKKGLDTSSLKIFLKNYKQFLKIHSINTMNNEFSFENSLEIIRSFLQDKKAFPYTKNVIEFANDKLQLEFKDQRVREITINRILGRIARNPELKEILKKAVINIRNESLHLNNSTRITKKQIITAETFNKWAEIIKNI